MTEEDVSSIQYFHEYSGDITRWSGWEDRKDIIQDTAPELIAAMKSLEVAERTLGAVVANLDRYINE